MKRSKKVLLSAVAVAGLSVASISFVSAFGGPNGYGGCGGNGAQSWQQGQNQGQMMQRHGYGKGMRGDMAKMMQDKLDRAKYKLRITEEQEPAWQAFTDVLAKKVVTLQERRQQRGSQLPVTDRVVRMRDGAEQMEQMADAVEAMYSALTPEQQKIADQMSPRGMRGF